MPENIPSQLIDLLDSVEPVSAHEARSRVAQTRGSRPRGTRALRPRWIAIGGAVAAAAAVATVARTGPQNPFRPGPVSAQSIRLVAATSTAAFSSGTAHADIRDDFGGTQSNTYSIDMSFSGSDLSVQNRMTLTPPIAAGTPMPPPVVLTDHLYLVGGMIYRNLGGKWYRESLNQASEVLTVPTPRTLLNQISPAAQLVSLGRDPTTGWTHLEAGDPQALLGMLNGQFVGAAGGDLTSFDLWIDDDHVARQMSWRTAGQGKTCVTQMSPITLPQGCTVTAVTRTATITFDDLGQPQSITAPQGAIPGSGQFDEPNS